MDREGLFWDKQCIYRFNSRNGGIVGGYSGPLCSDPSHINHHEVSLTRLDIGVSVRPVQNGQLHQLHFLQVVLPLGLRREQWDGQK